MPTDKDYGTNSKWNFPVKFTIDDAATNQNFLTLVINLKSDRSLGEREIGQVHVPIKELWTVYAKKTIYLVAIFEYLAIEVLELARRAARDNKKNRINPRHVLLAVKNDEELGKLLQGVTDSPLSKVAFCQTSTKYCLPKKTTTSESKKVSKLQL